METNLSLGLTMARLDAPSVVAPQLVQRCTGYRHAVRLAFTLGRVQGTNRLRLQRLLAEAAGAPASHVSDWLNADDKPGRRDLPAHRIPAFEAHVGNTLVSQCLAARARLTVLEELQCENQRKAA